MLENASDRWLRMDARSLLILPPLLHSKIALSRSRDFLRFWFSCIYKIAPPGSRANRALAGQLRSGTGRAARHRVSKLASGL